jgi:hypothetical protein
MTVSTNLLFLKAVNGVLLLVAALLFQALGRALGLPPPLVLASSLLMILNAHLLRSATIVMSEVPFLTLTMLALVAGVRAVESARVAWRDPWTWTAAVALAAAMTVRTAGLAVAVAVVL